MSLPTDTSNEWSHFYKKLEQFYRRHGHCNVPSDDKKLKELAKWVRIQKKAWHRLSTPQRDKLQALDSGFSSHQLPDWNQQYEALEQFFVKHGHAHVPATDPEYEDLHDWLLLQVKHQSTLRKDRKAKLDALAVHWELTTVRDWKWQDRYLQLCEFYREHGHSNVPQKWKVNPELSNWVQVQRREYQAGKMRKNRRKKLEALGFVWNFYDLYEIQWERHFHQLMAFKFEQGHCKVPLTYHDQQLAGWVDRQRTSKTKGTLPRHREEKLEKIGFIWDCNTLRENTWKQRFKQLKAYKKKYGDCLVPANWTENRSLGIWVSTQRGLEKQGKLDREKKKMLDEIGFVWRDQAWKLQLRKYDQQWEANFQKLREYQEKHQTLQVSVHVDQALERWTCIQRKQKQTGELKKERIRKLDQLGFPWDIHESYWKKMYEMLLDFRNKYGHTRVPWRWRQSPQLGQWVSRTRRRQYELTEDQIKLLNKISFSWRTIRKKPESWEIMFERLVQYKKKHGHARVPLRWEKDRKLGKWVSRMRSDRDKLLPERRLLLDQMGFDWQKRPGGRKKRRSRRVDFLERT